MAATAISLQLRPKRRPIANPNFLHFFSSSTPSDSINADDQNTPPPPPQPQHRQGQSLEEIRRNVSQFHRPSPAPPPHDKSSPAATPPISFQERSENSTIQASNKGSEGRPRFADIRESLRLFNSNRNNNNNQINNNRDPTSPPPHDKEFRELYKLYKQRRDNSTIQASNKGSGVVDSFREIVRQLKIDKSNSNSNNNNNQINNNRDPTSLKTLSQDLNLRPGGPNNVIGGTSSPGMASGDGARANWKDPELYKLFIDLCLKESMENGKNGGSLKKESWDRILVALNKEKGLNLTQKQVKNQWNFLKSKYGEWSKIISKTGNGYDPVTNTVNWSTEEWSEYIQANPNAKQFRYIGLQYSNELKALFDSVRATGRFSWGPSKEGFPTDDTQSQSDIGSLETPSSPNGDAGKHGNKQQKKNKSDDLNKQLLEALRTLQSSDGPTLEECNRILDEMQLFDMSDPLYIVACSIFCESKAHREQWMLLHQKPEVVRKSWIELNGKKLGLL